MGKELVKLGRPSKFTDTLAIELCRRIIEGQSLVRICRDDTMPHVATVYRWLNDNAQFCDRYARAKEEQADTLADEIIDIADNEPDPNRARVRVDARKWVAAKLKPKKYSDRQQLDHGVQGGGRVRFIMELDSDG